MKGLLLKDLLVLRRYLKTLVTIGVIYIAFGIIGDSPGFMANFLMIICAVVPITSLSYDEFARWDRFGASLPVSRREMVGAKYLLGILLCLTAAVATVLLSAGMAYFGKTPLTEPLMTTGTLLAIALIALSILLPIVYRFGVEHSRMFMAALFALPVAVILALGRLGVRIPFTERDFVLLGWALPFITVAALALSYRISCQIYTAKEL